MTRVLYIRDSLEFVLSPDTWDAPEVTEYGNPFGIVPSKMAVNVIQDNVINAQTFIFVLQFVLK